MVNRRELVQMMAAGALRSEIRSYGPVDFNCMVGLAARIPDSYASAKELLAELDYFGIEGAVAYHSLSRFIDVERGNAEMSRIARDAPQIRATWVVYPSTEELPDPEDFLARMRAAGARAIRIFPGQRDPNTFGLPLREWNFGPLLAAMEKHRVPLLVERPLLPWEDLYEAASKHPALPLLIFDAHFGEGRNIYTFLKEFRNVHFGTSRLQLFNGLEDLIRKFGAGRLVFDSGLPEREPTMGLGQLYFTDIGDAARKQILRGNFERLWEGGYDG